MSENIFSKTENILELYMYATGKSEVPPAWHKWCCLTMVAASLADRVWFENGPWQKLAPNLYTMLVGPSGLGKGMAIDFAMQFTSDIHNVIYGVATKHGLVDQITAEYDGSSLVPPSKILLVQPELAEAVGTGNLADTFVKGMTSFYNPSTKAYEEKTRTHGLKQAKDKHCINWLSGSTQEWIGDCVSLEAMMSGFFGRTCTVPGFYKFDERVYEIVKVPQYDEVVDYLKERFRELFILEGPFEMLPAAREEDENWYMNRPAPTPEMAPFWKRQHDLIKKLAMLLSACDHLDRTITRTHIVEAQKLAKEIESYMPIIMAKAMQDHKRQDNHKILAEIRRMPRGIHRTNLSRFASKLGINAKQLDTILAELIEMEMIESFSRSRRTWYRGRADHVIDWSQL